MDSSGFVSFPINRYLVTGKKKPTELFCLISSGAGLGQVDGSLWNLAEEQVFLHPRPVSQALPEQPCPNIAQLTGCKREERTWDGAPIQKTGPVIFQNKSQSMPIRGMCKTDKCFGKCESSIT